MGYESEHTRFMRDFLAKNPQVVEQQKKNRATWWDKPQDLETDAERAKSRVPQAGYVYFPSPEPNLDDPGV
ncbi:MAG TPA: DUF3460 family protein [Usitatibacter sp.]|nr:DUF3460 family protein [Usitatibacter sp.]